MNFAHTYLPAVAGDSTTTTTYSYDNNGNLTQKTIGTSTTTTYTWTYENKLKTVTLPDSSVTTFAYNPEGLRIKKIDSSGTAKYVLDGLAVLKEYDGSDNILATYTPGISLRKNSSSYFYHYDALGSTTETTDSSQTIATTYVYGAFGNLLSSGGTLTQPYRYVGQQFYYAEPDLSLQLLGQRWYDAEVGRFVSRDPILFPTFRKYNFTWLLPRLITQPLFIRSYVYVNNNPVNLVDPRGTDYHKCLRYLWAGYSAECDCRVIGSGTVFIFKGCTFDYFDFDLGICTCICIYDFCGIPSALLEPGSCYLIISV